MSPAKGHANVTRQFQVLQPSLRCDDGSCGICEQDSDLAALVDMALLHIARTGHFVTITESSAVTYGPGKQEATP